MSKSWLRTQQAPKGIGPLFDKPKVSDWTVKMGDEGPNHNDVCRNRHRGNPESTQAFETAVKHRVTEQQQRVLKCLRDRPEGLIAEEIAGILGVTVNMISGRCSELKRDGKIYKSGTRKTRSGCSAAILKAF